MPPNRTIHDPSEPESSGAAPGHESDATGLHVRRWEICRRDADNLHGVTARQVHIFKIERRLDRDRPLSEEARGALLELIDNHRREENDKAASVSELVERLKRRATPHRLRAIDGAVEGGPRKVSVGVASRFLLDALDSVGIEHDDALDRSVWSDLEKLIPYGAVFDFSTVSMPEDNLIRRCLFWGAAIRLATLDGDPPQDTDDLLAWCGYVAHRSEQSRGTAQWWSDFTDRMAGRPGNDVDRRLLDLPSGVMLTARRIRAAYKEAAKKAHPDVGGTAEQMTQLNQAKQRLLQALDT